MDRTVVIVDDKDIMRQALSRLFKAAGGFEVCGEASNGPEAIKLAQSLSPDLVVLDLCMPGMNGLETAEKLNALHLPTKTILYSLLAEEIATDQAKAAGVSAVVSKAEGVKTLIKKARNVLDKAGTSKSGDA